MNKFLKFRMMALVMIGALGGGQLAGSEMAISPIIPNQALAHAGATGIVKDRMDRFKSSQNDLKLIAAALKSGDHNSINAPALRIAAWADEMTSYFPQGSNPSPSEALDVIWQDPEAFQAAAALNGMAARRLANLADAGDANALKPAFQDVVASCKSCHQKFRK